MWKCFGREPQLPLTSSFDLHRNACLRLTVRVTSTLAWEIFVRAVTRSLHSHVTIYSFHLLLLFAVSPSMCGIFCRKSCETSLRCFLNIALGLCICIYTLLGFPSYIPSATRVFCTCSSCRVSNQPRCSSECRNPNSGPKAIRSLLIIIATSIFQHLYMTLLLFYMAGHARAGLQLKCLNSKYKCLES